MAAVTTQTIISPTATATNTNTNIRWRSAPKVTTPAEDRRPRRPEQRIPQSLIDKSQAVERQTWDAEKHLKFVPPQNRYLMKDIGLEGAGVSELAVSEPFQLFSDDAILQMRAEVFNENAIKKHSYRTSFAPYQIRGQCPNDALFTTSAWYDPKTLGVLSELAGIELVPTWDFEIGNINVSLPSNNAESTEDTIPTMTEEAKKDENEAFGWHFDCVPFVCVLMMSDCTGMVGGETVLRLGDGSTMKMRGPSQGSAVMMQGRYIEHKALKAMGGRERITMVTALRPKSSLVMDESTLAGVTGNSQLPELYYQYALYRAQVLEERFREQQKTLMRRHGCHQEIDVEATRDFLSQQRDYINQMLFDIEGH